MEFFKLLSKLEDQELEGFIIPVKVIAKMIRT